MAKIKDQDIEELRERADIVEVVSGYSHLKKAGRNTFKGLCPFHNEKTPSFTVDATRGLWHCFGCGEGGNLYQFVQKIENLPFPEAVDWLARRTGFELHYEEARPGEAAASSVRARLIAANAEAAEFFHRALLDSPGAAAARTYLESRNFGPEVARRWQLGFAPGGSSLTRHLLSHGFKQQELEQAYLSKTSERDGSLYDTFRGRITFPTWNLQGDVVGFGARALGDENPKYLNTSETPVFAKSRLLYGLNRAKSAIARQGAVVVEGYTDVIALHEAGIEQAVATNGVALGESHLEQLKKFTQRIYLMFDADAAGKGATERGFGLHHRLGLEVFVALLPSGRDPADVANEEGVEGIKKVLDLAQPLLQYKLEQTIAELVLDTPEARAKGVRSVVEVLLWHPDPIARHEYAFLAAERIGVGAEVVQRVLQEEARSTRLAPSERDSDRRLPGHVKVEREALELLLKLANESVAWLDELIDEDFTSAARRELFHAAREATASGVSAATIAQRLSDDARSLFTELTVGSQGPDIADTSDVQEIFVRLKVFSLEREIKQRRTALQKINPLEEAERHDELFTALVALEARRRDLLRRLQGAA